MNKQSIGKENIQLSLPMNAAYVSAARLTASSIANRLGFDIDEIEDIKAAVSESCTYIIKKASQSKNGTFSLAFAMEEGNLEIRFLSDVMIEAEDLESDMSLMMVRALMDDIEIASINKENVGLVMKKEHQKTSFD